jgi:protein-L-isoaspartate(D-aspartate) O-methyltransferase
MAALIAGLAHRVISVELRPALARLAAANLARAGVANAAVRCADGVHGLPGEAPFDAIALSGSVAAVPQQLLDQLRVGGRLVAIVGDEPMMRARLFRRTAAGAWSQEDLFDTVAPRLEGFPELERFSF